MRPEAIASLPPDAIVEVDARPLLEAGKEPFSLIMEGVQRTPNPGALRLRATFRPAPLFAVLGSQGFAHWVEHGEGADWIVWFYRTAGASQPGGSPERTPRFDAELAALQKDVPALRDRLGVEDGLWVLDVRAMSPPEPMELTLTVLDALGEGTSLLQLNERVPQFLLPLLEQRGYAYLIEEDPEGTVRVTIRKR